MSMRTVFIPWTHLQAPDFGAETANSDANAPNTHHGHRWRAVYYDDPHPNGVISTLRFGDRLHIAGHGEPGDHSIESSNGDSLTHEEVCDRLIEHGFSKKYVGTIVCDNCWSAVPKLGSQAFAAKVSQYLRGKGYLLISVQGFFGPLDGQPSWQPGHKFKHRYVTTPWGSEVKSKWMSFRF
jgi:hypothetical protein